MKNFSKITNKVALVTGSAGFIGSHLADKLLSAGYSVVGVDNFSLGTYNNIKHLEKDSNFTQIELDLVDKAKLKDVFSNFNINIVFHFAANSDVRLGLTNRNIDLSSNFHTTHNILESIVENNISEIVFSSTSAIYGSLEGDISENQGPLFPTSLYGSSKLAAEAFISVYCHLFEIKSWIIRFPNVVGPRLTHGVIFDFINKLKKNPLKLEILGDGKQNKPYLHVFDLLDAIAMVYEKTNDTINVFNVGPQDSTSVTDIANYLIDSMSLPEVEKFYTGGQTGWPGDVPKFSYDIRKIRKLGWKPSFSSDEAVRKAIDDNLK